MGAMINLNKNWIDLASMLQYSNDQIMIFFGKDLLQIHKLRLFSRMKLFEVGTCLNCLSLVNMIQYIKLVWKRRINIIFHKDQTNLQKQIKLKVDAENDSYLCKKLSGADHNWSKQIRNPWIKYEMLIFGKVWGLQLATLLPAITPLLVLF